MSSSVAASWAAWRWNVLSGRGRLGSEGGGREGGRREGGREGGVEIKKPEVEEEYETTCCNREAFV